MKQPVVKALTVSLLAASAILGLSQHPAMAQPGNGGVDSDRSGISRPSPEMRARFQREIGLSDEQMKQMDAIRSEGRAQSQMLRQQLKTRREEMTSYIKNPQANEAGALQRFRDMNDTQRQLGELRLKTFFQLRGKLTPEQSARLADFVDRKLQSGDAPPPSPAAGPEQGPEHGPQR